MKFFLLRKSAKRRRMNLFPADAVESHDRLIREVLLRCDDQIILNIRQRDKRLFGMEAWLPAQEVGAKLIATSAANAYAKNACLLDYRRRRARRVTEA